MRVPFVFVLLAMTLMAFAVEPQPSPRAWQRDYDMVNRHWLALQEITKEPDSSDAMGFGIEYASFRDVMFLLYAIDRNVPQEKDLFDIFADVVGRQSNRLQILSNKLAWLREQPRYARNTRLRDMQDDLDGLLIRYRNAAGKAAGK